MGRRERRRGKEERFYLGFGGIFGVDFRRAQAKGVAASKKEQREKEEDWVHCGLLRRWRGRFIEIS